MPRSRKTIDIIEVRRMANNFLEVTQPEQRSEREGVASFLESMLHTTNNYHGFRYLPTAEMTRNAAGYITDPDSGDESRRCYY